MDELIQQVAGRAGISPEQAKKAVESVAEFLKARVPALGGQIDALMQGGGNPLGGLGDKLGGLFGR
ncbi:MAG TPA: hypothetical protein VH092_24725 [Urbifossiella sp.]|nr:hypothetical protein [Urbifossiella sp.]